MAKILLEILLVAQNTPAPTFANYTGVTKVFFPGRHVERQTTQNRIATMEPKQQAGHFPGKSNFWDRMDVHYKTQKTS